MKTSTHSPFRIIVIIGLVAMMLAFPASATVETVVPTLRCSQAVVDGDPAEWNLTNDFVAEMYRAWDASKPVEAKLYMRYDVATSTAYVLVLATDGGARPRLAGAAWVAEGSVSNKVVTDGSGNDGILPDFSWVGIGYDGDPGHVRGYEAAFALTPGGHRIAAHLQVFDAGAPQTGGTNNKLIDIQTGCGVLGSIGDYVWNDADWAKDQVPN